MRICLYSRILACMLIGFVFGGNFPRVNRGAILNVFSIAACLGLFWGQVSAKNAKDDIPDFSKKRKDSFERVQWVKPIIGTGGHGHTFPGAVAPFGMVQLSPDTRNDASWDACGGYYFPRYLYIWIFPYPFERYRCFRFGRYFVSTDVATRI